jgi:hypothetical protein
MLRRRWRPRFLAIAVLATCALPLGCGGNGPTGLPFGVPSQATGSEAPPSQSAAPSPNAPDADVNALLHQQFKDVITQGAPGEIGELAASGVQPELSWSAVPDAYSYLVAVRADNEPVAWIWTGAAITVAYGATSETLDRIAGAMGVPMRLATVEVNTTYQWTVSALDAEGGVLAESSSAFECDAAQACSNVSQP